MKHKLLSVLFLILSAVSVAQTGTIKIVKPKEIVPPPKKDSLIMVPSPFIIALSAGTNYTFKKNNKLGFEAEVDFIRGSPKYAIGIGIQYSQEYRYFELSPYDKVLKQPAIAYSKSQNKLEFIKLPILINYSIYIGAGALRFSIGAMPEYLISKKNEYNRLIIKDYNQFNVAGFIGLRFKAYRSLGFGIRYSKEFLQELKDINVYDNLGNSIGKQNSKTSLLSVSLTYVFAIKRSSRVTHIDKRVL